jgi:hypothetical protein
MVLHLHPWIISQPWRIRHLDEVLGHICARQGVWKATGREIIDWFKAQASQCNSRPIYDLNEGVSAAGYGGFSGFRADDQASGCRGGSRRRMDHV